MLPDTRCQAILRRTGRRGGAISGGKSDWSDAGPIEEKSGHGPCWRRVRFRERSSGRLPSNLLRQEAGLVIYNPVGCDNLISVFRVRVFPRRNLAGAAAVAEALGERVRPSAAGGFQRARISDGDGGNGIGGLGRAVPEGSLGGGFFALWAVYYRLRFSGD